MFIHRQIKEVCHAPLTFVVHPQIAIRNMYISSMIVKRIFVY